MNSFAESQHRIFNKSIRFNFVASRVGKWATGMSCPEAQVAVKRLRPLALKQEEKSRHANALSRPLFHTMSLLKNCFFGYGAILL